MMLLVKVGLFHTKLVKRYRSVPKTFQDETAADV